MIVRIEVHQQTDPETYWQLKRCQAHIAGTAREIGQPPRFHPMRFLTLEDAIRSRRASPFTIWRRINTGRYRIKLIGGSWRNAHVFPCPACQQPLYRKAKWGRTRLHLDLKDWGCPRCKKTVTLNTEGCAHEDDSEWT